MFDQFYTFWKILIHLQIILKKKKKNEILISLMCIFSSFYKLQVLLLKLINVQNL